jgi:phosphoglycolate phosphatase
MKKYDVIAFDLDGTLTNPERGLIASFVYALGKMGVDYGEKEELKRFIGPPIYEEWQRVFGFTPEESSKALLIFREYYSVYGWWDNEMYPGVPEMLRALCESGKKIILATSKPEVFARKILDLFDIAKYFDYVGGADTDKTRDKKHEVLAYSMASLGVTDTSRVILVGDRVYDAEGARACGVDSLGVLYGHGSREEIENSGFNYICESVEDIAKTLI